MAYAATTGMSAATSGQVMADAIRDTVAAHANWETEESGVVVGSKTGHVMKCLAAGNSAGIDFRAIFQYVTATPTSLHVKAAEGYNTGTDQVTKPCFANSVAGLDTDNSLAGSFAFDSTTNWHEARLTPSSTTRLDLVVNANRIMGFMTDPASAIAAWFYVGLIERSSALTAGQAPMQLVNLGSATSSVPAPSGGLSGGGTMSRHPTKTAGSTFNGVCAPARWPQGSSIGATQAAENSMADAHPIPHVFPAGAVGWGTDAFNSALEAGKIPVVTAAPDHGGTLGYLKDVVLTRVRPASIPTAFGDTITIGGVTYVYMGNGTRLDPDTAVGSHTAMWASTAD